MRWEGTIGWEDIVERGGRARRNPERSERGPDPTKGEAREQEAIRVRASKHSPSGLLYRIYSFNAGRESSDLEQKH